MQDMTRTIIYILSIFFGCLLTKNAHAEQIGTWRLYQSFNNITEISPAGNMCFALASGSLFAYNTTTSETSTYDKTNSLSDNNITHIRWSATTKRLVITYENSNIDLLNTNGSLVNVANLYLKSTTKDKTINHIYCDGNYAYLSLGFGVMKLDIRRGVIADTYQLDFNIAYSYTKDGYIYAASKEKGMFRGKLSDNLLDKNSWQHTGDYTALKDDRLNVQDATTKLWWTKNSDGKLTYYSVDNEGKKEYKTEGVLPEGPASNRFYKLYMHGGKLYSVAGFFSQEKDCNYPGEVHVWDGNVWTEFEQPTKKTLGHDYTDHLCLDFDPKKEGHVMVGSKSGLYEFQDGKFVRQFYRKNSVLESGPTVNSDNYSIIAALKYMDNGDLWVLNSMATNPIWKVSLNEDKWTSMPHSDIKDDDKYNLSGLSISRSYNNVMWFVNNYWEKNIVYAYDYANDKYIAYGPTFTNEDGDELKPIFIYNLTEDLKGNLWIASSSGPFYITVADALAGNANFVQHKVPRNDGTNLADYLLANVRTRCIAVDGANRKWIGTENGVFLISDDCNTQLQHFTTDNSPLLSNTIYDVYVDPNSNTVYFATDKGLCSYASDATQPAAEMVKDNVYAYPNPVTPDYSGKITIVGLSFNSDVKIVTNNGTLVNQGRSTGGSYQWDGHNLKGKRVASGIYMVEAATENGEKGTVCKIAVVN